MACTFAHFTCIV